MKKLLKKITALICVLMLVISVSGCSIILDTDPETNAEYELVTVDVSLSKQYIFRDTKDYTAQPVVNQVRFYTNGVTEDYDSYEKAAKDVMRSVVEIILLDNLGNHYAYGSGVIVDIDGGLDDNEYYIVTCHHIVSSAENIAVCVPDANARNYGDVDYDERYMFTGYIGGDKQTNSDLAVSLVGGDVDSDIAVLKLKVGNSSLDIQKAPVPATNQNELKYAQQVFAIGNPSGKLPMTFLGGNISYIDRTVVLDGIGYMNVIQHDTMITHGSSGGALFNMKGQLIGITNAGSDTYKGMNYAIPYYGIDGYLFVAKQLIKNSTPTNYGYVEGRWSLGVTITDTTATIKGSSVKVVSVETGSNVSGLLKKNDYIVKIEFNTYGGETYSEEITSSYDFKGMIFLAREALVVGDTIRITVAREKLLSLL